MKTNKSVSVVLGLSMDQLETMPDDEILRQWQKSGLRAQMLATAHEAINRGLPVDVVAQAAGIHPDDLSGLDPDEFDEALRELDSLDPMNRIVEQLIQEYKSQGIQFDAIPWEQLTARAEIVYAHELETKSCGCESCKAAS